MHLALENKCIVGFGHGAVVAAADNVLEIVGADADTVSVQQAYGTGLAAVDVGAVGTLKVYKGESGTGPFQ